MADNQSNPNSANEAAENPQENLTATNGDAVSKSGLWQYLAELVLAGAVGTGVWLFGEHLVSNGHTFGGSVVNFAAFCIYFATIPITTVKIWSHPKSVWISFCVFCVLMALAFTFSSRPSTKLKPHFTLSLQIGGSSISTIVLTNDCFFRVGMVNVIHSTNDFLVFNGIVNGCIVIPVQQGESNKAFSFIAENDSPIKVNDLEIAVGLPKEWELGLDSTKWHMAEEHLMIPGWRLQITNLQFLASQCPWPLYPSDSVTFPPITNYSIPEFNNPSNKVGLFKLTIRSTDFLEQLSANIVFVRITSNSFKPFITGLDLGTNGVWRFSMSPREFEESQK